MKQFEIWEWGTIGFCGRSPFFLSPKYRGSFKAESFLEACKQLYEKENYYHPGMTSFSEKLLTLNHQKLFSSKKEAYEDYLKTLKDFTKEYPRESQDFGLDYQIKEVEIILENETD